MKDSPELILTHARADFDAFASMLLAARLYPEALPVLPSSTVYRLRELLSLYRDVADFQSIRQLRKRKGYVAERIIVVDTKKCFQLKEFSHWLEEAEHVKIFDHHPPTSDDCTRSSLEQFPYGANATGLYFKLADKGRSLSPQEATIVLLGIYADTGNLIYPGTTSEDALAVSELLRAGADLNTVNYYLRPYMDPAQRLIFRDLLVDLQEYDMEGYKVVMVKKRLEKVMPGISFMVNQVGDMSGADAILGVFASKTDPGVQMIIQSLVPEINAFRLARYFDGGGHPGASAAFLPRADLDGVADTLLTLLTEAPLPLVKVRDVMTTRLITLTPELTIGEADRRLIEGNVHGAPVVKGPGELVGVISTRDVQKARIQNLLHAPVSAFMSSAKLLTINPDTPLVTAKKIISSHDIGRLPVLEENILVGIISRSDLLNGQNGRSSAATAA